MSKSNLARSPEVPGEKLDPPDESLETMNAALEALLPIARAIPEDRLRPINVALDVAVRNARRGYSAIESHLDELRRLPGIDVEAIEGIPRTVLALLAADMQLRVLANPPSDVPATLKEARRIRKGLLLVAKGAVDLGFLPAEPVRRITRGTGPLDTANDLIQLVMLFQNHEVALQGRLAICSDTLNRALELGTWLYRTIRPIQAPRRPKDNDSPQRQAQLDRLRLWTLLHIRYDELRRAAAYLGIEVLPLQSKTGRKRRKAKSAKATDY